MADPRWPNLEDWEGEQRTIDEAIEEMAPPEPEPEDES